MKISASSIFLLGAAAPALAKPGITFWPSQLMARAVSDPNVIEPNTGTVWYNGTVHNVTWNTQGLSPPTCGAVLNTAMYLAVNGTIPSDGSVGSTTQPISSNFSLSRGRIEIFVPNVTTANTYQIVLKADTSDPTDEGSYSGLFAITFATTT